MKSTLDRLYEEYLEENEVRLVPLKDWELELDNEIRKSDCIYGVKIA